MGEANQDENCRVCRKKVRDGIQCDKCDQWLHAKCQDLENSAYKVLKENSDLLWFCKECKPGVKNMLRKMKELEEQNIQLGKNVGKVEANVGNLDQNLTTLVGQVQEILENQKSIGIGLQRDRSSTDIENEITNRVMQQIKDMEYEKERKKNLVLYNIDESRSQDVRIGEGEDLSQVEGLFSRSLGIAATEFNITRTKRLGKEQVQGRARPLLVILANEKEKWHILKEAPKLKHEQNPEIRKIGISLDLTREEREANKRLREELRERRNRGKRNIIIKNGKIVTTGERQR